MYSFPQSLDSGKRRWKLRRVVGRDFEGKPRRVPGTAPSIRRPSRSSTRTRWRRLPGLGTLDQIPAAGEGEGVVVSDNTRFHITENRGQVQLSGKRSMMVGEVAHRPLRGARSTLANAPAPPTHWRLPASQPSPVAGASPAGPEPLRNCVRCVPWPEASTPGWSRFPAPSKPATTASTGPPRAVSRSSLGRVLSVVEGRTVASLDGFWQQLTAGQLRGVRLVAMDMFLPPAGTCQGRTQDHVRQVPHRQAPVGSSGRGEAPGTASIKLSAAGDRRLAGVSL